MQNFKCNDTMVILSQVLDEMKSEKGESFSLESVNLADLERRTGISRMKLRRLKKNGFKDAPHGLSGRKAKNTVLTGYTGIIDNLLRSDVSNSSVIYDRLKENGYTGGLTQVKVYISEHKDLLPPKRYHVDPQGNRGRRYETGPGESYQMDWGFINVDSYDGSIFQAACFAMICHHCGEQYVEFFTNAKQENLFIGMIHAFMYMGVPKHVLTDNMKSVVVGRDSSGHPIWNTEYSVFMKTIGFETKLCKPRHPFTKGKVERLIRFVKDNFLAGRVFYNISDLNEAAMKWCGIQNSKYHKTIDSIPVEIHFSSCCTIASEIVLTAEILGYLCPIRKISFDGFVCYEGRRFGVPYWYTEHSCRVRRDKDLIYLVALDFSNILTTHNVTWSYRDSFCESQYCLEQPEELPTMPVKDTIRQLEPLSNISPFDKFNFDKEEGL